jgi:tetrahydromethanopterin S-methyltransferase subunit E
LTFSNYGDIDTTSGYAGNMVDKSQKKQPSIIAEVAIGLIIVLIFIVQSVRLKAEARSYLNRALEADPTDPGAISMNLKLKESEQQEKETNPPH